MSSRLTGINFVRPALYALTGVAVLAAPRLPVLADLEWDDWAIIVGTALLLAAVTEVFLSANRRPHRPLAPHRTDFTPLAALGRSSLDPLVCGIVVALAIATVSAEPSGERPIHLPLLFAIFGCILGYNLWRRRSPNPWLQVTLSVVLPLLLALLFFAANSPGPNGVTALMSFLPATALGSWGGSIAERVSGRQSPKRLRAAWRGVNAVVAGHIELGIAPLLEQVSRSEAKQAAANLPLSPRASSAIVLKWLFLVMWPVILILIPTAFTDEKYVTGPDAPSQITGMAAVFSLLILGYAIIGFIGLRSWRQTTSPADHLRLARFAAANGFSYHPGPLTDRRGGTLTRAFQADGWTIANVARSEQEAGSAAPVTLFSGISEFKLPVALPHLLLVQRRLRAPAFSAYRAPLRSQRLRLEGDFNRYFTLYCPAGYERDALYLLTPDVMAAFIDGARQFDVEIIDDRLVLSSRRDLATVDPAAWASITHAVSALADRTTQWQRWRDDRHEALDAGDAPKLRTELPDGPAKLGRRLRGGASVGLLLTLGYATVYVALTWLANTL